MPCAPTPDQGDRGGQGPGAVALVFPGFLRLGFRADLCSQAAMLGRLDTCVPPGKLLKRPPLAFVGTGSGGRRRPAGQLEGLSLPHLTSPSPASEEGQCPGPSRLRPGVGLPEGPPVLADPGLRLRLTQTGGLSLPPQLSALQRFEKAGGHLSLGLSARVGRGWGPQDKGGAGPQISPRALKVFLSVLPVLKKQVIKHS